ncbi:hypothetical protein THAOC_00565, partial [Thalassiosira oceanica]
WAPALRGSAHGSTQRSPSRRRDARAGSRCALLRLMAWPEQLSTAVPTAVETHRSGRRARGERKEAGGRYGRSIISGSGSASNDGQLPDRRTDHRDHHRQLSAHVDDNDDAARGIMNQKQKQAVTLVFAGVALVAIAGMGYEYRADQVEASARGSMMNDSVSPGPASGGGNAGRPSPGAGDWGRRLRGRPRRGPQPELQLRGGVRRRLEERQARQGRQGGGRRCPSRGGIPRRRRGRRGTSSCPTPSRNAATTTASTCRGGGSAGTTRARHTTASGPTPPASTAGRAAASSPAGASATRSRPRGTGGSATTGSTGATVTTTRARTRAVRRVGPRRAGCPSRLTEVSEAWAGSAGRAPFTVATRTTAVRIFRECWREDEK